MRHHCHRSSCVRPPTARSRRDHCPGDAVGATPARRSPTTTSCSAPCVSPVTISSPPISCCSVCPASSACSDPRELPAALSAAVRRDHRRDQRDRVAPRDPLDVVVDRARSRSTPRWSASRTQRGPSNAIGCAPRPRSMRSRAAAPAWRRSARTCRFNRRWPRSIGSKFADAILPACTSWSPITT